MTEVIRRQFLATEYGQMHVRLAGVNTSASIPLVCLHMAPQSGQDFEAFMSLAGQHRLVIAPDYHGYGESDPMPENVVTIENYAKSIWQVLEALKISQVEILGYHTGSKVGIEMSLQFPQRVEKLLCISLSTLTPEQYASKKTSFAPLPIRFPGDELTKWWKTLKGYYDPDISIETLVQKYTISLKSGPRFHLGFAASHHYNATVLEKLACLGVPTALINPNDDLQNVTPLAEKFIENCVLINEPNWLPGFLDIKPEDVLKTMQSAFELLDNKNKATEQSLG